MRGVFEKPKGSGVWWINYYHQGTQRREKVGTKSAAQKLYTKRKADALLYGKVPELRKSAVLTLGNLVDELLPYSELHHRDTRNYKNKAKIVKAALGDRPAGEITPQEITRWLASRGKSPATFNRYKSFISLAYREGMANGKVTTNPARLVRQMKESQGRLRFLSREEYGKLLGVIREKFPEREVDFVVSVHTGMRLSEQYSVTWGAVDFNRKTIHLSKTKNGSERDVLLHKEAVAALKAIKLPNHRSTDKVFVLTDWRTWFAPAMEEAGITGYVWHSNRHTFCSWLAMAGASIKEIQELAGHKTISMSARYSHLSPDHKHSVLDRITA